MSEHEIKFIRQGRYVDPNGKDLGAVEKEKSKAAGNDQGDSGSQQAAEDTRTVAQLKDALTAKGVAFEKDAVKADLQKLAADHGA